MLSEFFSCLFCFFTILQTFPGDTLVPNKPDTLCDKPINSVVRQPTNTALFLLNAPFLVSLLYIWCIYSQGIKLQAFAPLAMFVAAYGSVHALISTGIA